MSVDNNTSTSPPVQGVQEKFDKAVEEFEKTLPKDELENAIGVTPGTPEHSAQTELIGRIKDNNSTRRVLQTTDLYRVISYPAIIVSFALKIAGAIFDINYHLPDLALMLGMGTVVFLGVLVAVTILSLSHLSSDGLVNNKWRHVPRIILAVFFTLAMLATFYLDNRAIQNYNKQVVEIQKTKKLQNKNDKDSIMVNAIRSQKESIDQDLNSSKKRLDSLYAQLENLAKEKLNINREISSYKTKKSKTTDKKTIRKLNSNIYTSRKQLAQLNSDADNINSQINTIKTGMDLSNKKMLELANSEKDQILNVDKEMEQEKRERVLFAWIFVIFFEIGSFMGIIAKFLENKNRHKDLSNEQIDEFNAIVDEKGVLMQHISQLKLQELQRMNRDLSIGRAGLNAIGAMGSSQLMQQTTTVKDVIDTTIVATNEISKIGKFTIAKHVEYLKGDGS